MVILYANAGQGVGTGHIFRLFPVLQGLQKEKIPVRMVVPLPEVTLNDLGLQCVESIKPGIKPVDDLLRKERPEIFWFDSYEKPNLLIEKVSKWQCKIFCFDDHYNIKRPVNTIINPALNGNAEKYKDVSLYSLIGPDYFPLTDDFKEVRKLINIRSEVRRIMVAMGGDDIGGSLDRVLSVLLNIVDTKIIVDVYGNSMPPVVHPMINKIGWLPHNDLIRKLGEYDLAILAGGSMLQQSACIGLPVISWPQHLKQAEHAGNWEKKGSVMVVITNDEFKSVFKKILDVNVRKHMSQAGYETVDGAGVNRLIAHLKKILN